MLAPVCWMGLVLPCTWILWRVTVMPSPIHHDGRGIFKDLSNPFTATRYHSLVIERESIPGCLEITAQSEDGEIMGVRHTRHAVEGVQFHPEAILTEHGHQLLKNFLRSSLRPA